ncbi:hypothetical protein H1R20_g585, partial [Candolleomyces eurysporus]
MQNTNVIKLYNRIAKGKKQRTYYNSGVGTFADSSWLSVTSWARTVDNKIDQAVAKNFDQIILGAYRWLSELYKGPKDKIYIFAGMIDRVGLLHRGNEEQIPFAYKLYSGTDDRLAKNFKETFSKDVGKIHFVGVWDTVSSVGVVRDKTLPLSDNNNHICFFRHALALDEQRVKFLPEYIRANKSAPEDTLEIPEYDRPPRAKEVWFPGRHSDVYVACFNLFDGELLTSDSGGGNADHENFNIGRIALHWMAYEAVCCGLELDPVDLDFDRPEDFFGTIPHSVAWKWLPLEGLFCTRLNYDPTAEHKEITRRPHFSGGRIPVPGQKLSFAIFQRTLEGEMRPYTSRANFSKLSTLFKDWEDIVRKANGFKDSSRLLEEWKDYIEPDPLCHFGISMKLGPKVWESLPSLERRIAIYEARVCYSSHLVRWQLCDPAHVDLSLSGQKFETQKVFLEPIIACYNDSLSRSVVEQDVTELVAQARLVGVAWEADDLIPTPPRVIANFPSSECAWLIRVIQDITLSEDIRVLAARIFSCTFATDLGRALMYLVRSPKFLVHLGAMHKHKQRWIRDRALNLVLSLLDRDSSLIRETQSERQSGDGPNDLKAWAVVIAKEFAGKSDVQDMDKQAAQVVA